MAGQAYDKNLGIKDWSEEDRPREKLMLNGYQALTKAELLAILIGSGTKNKSAVEVAKTLLNKADGNLQKVGKFSINQLTEIPGIGKAKAISIAAALELGRRRKNEAGEDKIKIDSSNKVYETIYPYLADKSDERFYILLLDRGNNLIKKENISKGGVSGTVVDPKIVFKIALEELASSIILCHNHPSGTNKPSEADKELTNKLKQAGENMEIKVLDHLIFAGGSYFSFNDEGLI